MIPLRGTNIPSGPFIGPLFINNSITIMRDKPLWLYTQLQTHPSSDTENIFISPSCSSSPQHICKKYVIVVEICEFSFHFKMQ